MASNHFEQHTQEIVPLLLHVNSISSGLVFNYFYSYLNRQITTTNNIFIKFSFTRDIDCETLPATISVRFDTVIEDVFLRKSPSTESPVNLVRKQTKRLLFAIDRTQCQIFNSTQAIVTYALCGTYDFGVSVEKMSIWQQGLNLDCLHQINLTDGVRDWNEVYQLCSLTDVERTIMFTNQRHPTKKCFLYPLDMMSDENDGFEGVSTMKQTTSECYRNQQMDDVRMVPVYYIIMPVSCQFEPADTSESSESEPVYLTGTIRDPDDRKRIQLARIDRNVLRSRPMTHYNRYLRRTFYYVNNKNIGENQNYLFSAEYPYILSALDHLEKCGVISKAQKYDEYLRFCNMLHQLIKLNNLSESIQLIEFNDDKNICQNSDSRTLWQQIKSNIDQWYERSDDDLSADSIDTRLLRYEQNNCVRLFYTHISLADFSIGELIKDLQSKLESRGFTVYDTLGDFSRIISEQQTIFICSGNSEDKVNNLMMDHIERKINTNGVLHDIFILVNDAICNFPYRFIRSVPYLTFDLRNRSSNLNNNEIDEIIYYLRNMNIMSRNYTDIIQHTNERLSKSPLSCTSIGQGCAYAFYFNYAKLIVPLSDHRIRMEIIEDQIRKENLIDSIFIRKWIFVIPWTIENAGQILPNAISISENQQNKIGYRLSEWKSQSSTFAIPNLYITVGGVFQRSYSPLKIYKLTNLTERKTFYFPMEIPAALNGLQNQYQHLLSHFKFGSFDPLKQATIFRETVENLMAKDSDRICHENIILVSMDKPTNLGDIQQTDNLLGILWNKIQDNL